MLRPRALRDAMDAVYEPGHRALQPAERAKDRERLVAAENLAIEAAVRRQEDIGLDVVSDGEFRRYMFLNSFWDAVEGFSTDKNPVQFRNAAGETVTWHVQRIESRLRQVDSPAAREAAFLKSTTTRPFKVTFPAASLFTHPATWKPGVTDAAYGSLEELVAHAIEIERGLVADAVRAGAGYVQFDFPLYPYLADPTWREQFAACGHDLETLLDAAVAADMAVLEGIPDDVKTALHICRGNYRSRWLCDGSLEPVAERMFGELPYDTFLVEWDDIGRDGGYAPVRHVPPGRTMVLGLISTKTARVESVDDIVRRTEEASAYLPLGQLAVSPQCGFASVVEGNEITEDVQWRKLELVTTVADRLWG